MLKCHVIENAVQHYSSAEFTVRLNWLITLNIKMLKMKICVKSSYFKGMC